MTVFDDTTHRTLFLTGSTLQSAEKIRASEMILKALQQVGLLSRLTIADSAPGDTAKLWLDRTTDPDTLKYYDGATWAAVTDSTQAFGILYPQWTSRISLSQFGAVGDGVTNDLADIQTAIDAVSAAGGGDIFGTPGAVYKISGDLRISEGVRLDLSGATIQVTNTTDSVIVETAAFINNGTLSAFGVASYAGPLLLVDDGDGFARGSGEEFGGEQLRLVGPGAGASAAGTGVKLHGTSAAGGYGVTKGRFRRLDISNFAIGIHLYSEVSWVNDNRFYGCTIYGCIDFVKFQRGADTVDGNHFEGMIQPNTSVGIASRAFYCEGRYNTFHGNIWDWNASGSTIAVEFAGTVVSQNMLIAMIDPIYVKDDATDESRMSTIVVISGTRKPLTHAVMAPFTTENTTFQGVDDILCYADKLYTLSSSGDAPTSGAWTTAFQPNSSSVAWASLTSAVVKVDLGASQTYLVGAGVLFGFNDYAEDVLIEYSVDDSTYSTLINITDNKGGHAGVCGKSFIGSPFRYLRFTIANSPARATNIQRIYAYSANLPGTQYLGRLGGRLYGNTDVEGYLSIKDGMTAPGAGTGQARIYVDTADGDLKVVFADGTVKTIVVDT